MKLTTLTAVLLLSSATYAFAGAGAPVPEGSQKDAPSGRPGKVLSAGRVPEGLGGGGP